MSDEKERGVIFTPKVEEVGKIDEFPTLNSEEKINVKSVLTPEEVQALLPKDVELLEGDAKVEGKLMDGIEELAKDLTDKEKKAIFIEQLKESHIRFKPIKHGVTKTIVVGTEPTFFGRKRVLRSKGTQTNVTTNQFDADYRKKRKNKNRMARASRKVNR